MIRKILLVLVVAPIALVAVALAVANRHAVTVSYDPLAGGDPALAVTLPLFLVILLAVIAGVVLGGIAAWFRQGKWRRAARAREHEAARLRREANDLRRRAEEARGTPAIGPPPGPAARVS